MEVMLKKTVKLLDPSALYCYKSHLLTLAVLNAGVVKLVDALDSKSSGATRVGSIPTSGTIMKTRAYSVLLKALFIYFVLTFPYTSYL